MAGLLFEVSGKITTSEGPLAEVASTPPAAEVSVAQLALLDAEVQHEQ